MAGKKRKTVSGLENPSAYKKAIASLNKIKGKKSGDKGYITPSQALNDFRKYSSVEAIERHIEKYKSDKELKKLVSQYNKYNGYNRGETGFLNISSARYIGTEELKEHIETAKENYTIEVKQRADYNRKVKQSLKDEEKLKDMAKSVLESIQIAGEINRKMMNADNQEEYDKLSAQLKKAVDSYRDKYIEFAKEDEKLHKKYRNMNKLPVSEETLNIEKLRKIPSGDIESILKEVINRGNKKDMYGNPATLYSKYHSSVSQTVESILSATLQTEVKIGGKETKKLIDIIQTKHINNEKFWKAFRAWENDGANVHGRNGKGDSDLVSASSFFTTTEGHKLLYDMLKTEYKEEIIEFSE